MRTYLLLGIGLALAGCATQKALPHYSEAEKQAQRESIGFWQPAPAKPDSASHTKPPMGLRLPPIAAPDSLPFIAVTRQPSFLAKLFGRTPKTTIYPGLVPVRAGKKSTVNIFNAPATVTTLGKKATGAVGAGAVASVIEKKAGPAVVASDSSTQNAILGAGNLAAVHGDGNTLPQTTTTQEAPGALATLAKPASYVLAALGTVVIVGGCIFLIAAYKRRNLLNNNG